MAKKQLKIKVLPNGEIQMETVGIKGKKCTDYISLMEAIAQAKVIKQNYTEEYYEQENEVTYNENIYDNEQNNC